MDRGPGVCRGLCLCGFCRCGYSLARDKVKPVLKKMNSSAVTQLPSVEERQHKVVVRFCSGYNCRNTITTHRVRQNINGKREYCSLICYHRWSPAMRSVIERFPQYEQSPRGLEALLCDLREEHGNTGAAEIIGYSRSTITNWLKKLSCFRRFAGQPPDVILWMLKRVADDHGIDQASSLIAVDPKTLLHAFEKLEVEPEQLAS